MREDSSARIGMVAVIIWNVSHFSKTSNQNQFDFLFEWRRQQQKFNTTFDSIVWIGVYFLHCCTLLAQWLHVVASLGTYWRLSKEMPIKDVGQDIGHAQCSCVASEFDERMQRVAGLQRRFFLFSNLFHFGHNDNLLCVLFALTSALWRNANTQVSVDWSVFDSLFISLFFFLFANLLPPRYHGEILSTALLHKSEVLSKKMKTKKRRIEERA